MYSSDKTSDQNIDQKNPSEHARLGVTTIYYTTLNEMDVKTTTLQMVLVPDKRCATWNLANNKTMYQYFEVTECCLAAK